MPRFVILQHTGCGCEHWDLMLEQGDSLATWQLLRSPATVEQGPIPARRIGDHRLAYLTYEGPVSRDRGEVRRVDEGTYVSPDLPIEPDGASPTGCAGRGQQHLLTIQLAGLELRGMFQLRRAAAGEEWDFSRIAQLAG